MNDAKVRPEEGVTAGDPAALYGPEYYASQCGDQPYTRDSPAWLEFYGRIADEIVRSLAPRRVFDAGCAIGFLVEALWDRGLEARGRDISPYAISQVRADVRPYCAEGSIADPIDGGYDLVLCIEVLEHMPEPEAQRAIDVITTAAPRVLFSSSPIDLDEPTHINVRPTIYWLQQFAEAGFAPVPGYDATFVCPHAMLLERSERGRDESSLAALPRLCGSGSHFPNSGGRLSRWSVGPPRPSAWRPKLTYGPKTRLEQTPWRPKRLAPRKWLS
jgi:SAM-dependent methyltransferase